MGTFQGHVLPGAFFMAFALWWMSQIPRRHVLCRRLQVPFFNTATYPFPAQCCKGWPVEGLIKVIATVAGMTLELFASMDYGKAGKVVYLGDIQHFTMYAFFCLSGVADILRSKNALFAPPGLDYLVAALAFATEWLLFSNHLHGRSPLDVAIHTFLLYVIAATVLVILLEFKYPASLVLGLCRCVLTLLQGSWFIQVGFILYPPTPALYHLNEHDQDNIMFCTMMFTWHCGGWTITVILAFVLLSKLYEKSCATFELKLEEIPWRRAMDRSDSGDTDDEDDEEDEAELSGYEGQPATLAEHRLSNELGSSDEETDKLTERQPLMM